MYAVALHRPLYSGQVASSTTDLEEVIRQMHLLGQFLVVLSWHILKYYYF